MEVYLIRHGIAAERGTYDNDELRPLTDKGRKKTSEVAQKLRSIGLKFDQILTSPLVRAYQTAEILVRVGLGQHLEKFAPLAPDGNIQDWLSWQAQWYKAHQNSKIGLVGHQPDLGNWAEILVWGSVKEKLVVKKAGVIGLQVPEGVTPVGQSELFLLASPKWLM
ncbi:phosphohistidine phosphatase SixA [Pleurocapsales cyanobacterium LEGE 06147]|nr:phosphohistidine phosphatase SixA [Pleurocapsales cyanobacterium LEGE 06147]